jgi:hypothetical protein
VKDASELSVLVFDGRNELLDLIEIAEIHLPIAQLTGFGGQSVYETPFFRAQCRAPRQHYSRLAGLVEDLSGKENTQAAEPTGNQVDTVIFERDR